MRELAADRDLVLVEGAGGLLVRYDDDGATLADLAHALSAPTCCVVSDPALGTLNHTALTLEAMAHRGLALAGLVHRRLAGRSPTWPAAATCATSRRSPRARWPVRCGPGSGRWTRRSSCSPPATGWGPALGGTFDAADFRRAHDPAG